MSVGFSLPGLQQLVSVQRLEQIWYTFLKGNVRDPLGHRTLQGGLSLLVPHRRYLAVFGGIWRYLAVFGGIWRYLAVFGGIWRYLAVFGGIWRYLAVFGGIWYLCVLCVMSAEWLYTVVGIYQHNGHK